MTHTPQHGRPGILAMGMAVPDRILTNFDLQKMVDTNDEWIVARTGIRERRISSAEETSGSLGTLAARQALSRSGIEASQLDAIICATTSGDYVWPATACVIQQAIAAGKSAAFDLSAACAGFTYGLGVAAALIAGGAMSYVLLVGADTLTKQLNWQDRGTCILFGDGASAAVLGRVGGDTGILSSYLGADGNGINQILIPAGGTLYPLTPERVEQRLNCIAMRGAEVYRFAVKIMGEACLEALDRACITPEQVDLFVPHQANLRIINAAAERMGLPPHKVFTNVERYGNTSAASVGIALYEAEQMGKLKPGSVVVTVGFGAGLTWGANVIRWGAAHTGAELVV